MTNIAQVLFNRARSHPQLTAVSYGSQSISFAELGHRARQLAGALHTRARLNAGDRVVLCMENRPEFFELLFACWTAGLCAVPVNAKLHPREVSHIVTDSGARAQIGRAHV